ncbi:MAG TPA: hypothetical protein VNJ71_05075 [Gemmatimonadales bacterium]|nr:hypothetical protein [Gemmatimonadales bacterium]
MIRALERVVAPTALIATGTWLVGWWSVPLLAAAWQLRRRDTPPWLVGIAGFLAWAALLGWLAPAGPKRELADRLAALLGTPGFVPGFVTPLFAGLLAWSAAGVVFHLLPIPPRSSLAAPRRS